MERILALMDAIIKEHKQLRKDVETTEHIADDLGAVLELDRATGDFEPAMLDRKRQGLQRLRKELVERRKE